MKAGELIYAGINRKKYLKNNGLSFQYSCRQALKINIRCPQINNRTIPISTKRIFQPKNPFGASFNLLSRSIRSDQIGFDFIGRTSKKYAEAKIEIMMAQSDVHSAEMVDPPKPSFRVVGLLIKLFGLLITLMGWVGLTGISESLAYQSALNQSQLDLRTQGLQVSLGNCFIGIGISFMFIVVGLSVFTWASYRIRSQRHSMLKFLGLTIALSALLGLKYSTENLLFANALNRLPQNLIQELHPYPLPIGLLWSVTGFSLLFFVAGITLYFWALRRFGGRKLIIPAIAIALFIFIQPGPLLTPFLKMQ